jgi:pseudouridine kinase
MGILVIGATFVDIKGFPYDNYLPTGRNAGRVEYIHGGVGRNVAEDVANCELRPTFISLVDDTGAGRDVVEKLKRHKVNTDYIRVAPDGMGTWLAVFDDDGDVFASISKRPDLRGINDILDQQGDEIFADAKSVIIEIDLEKDTVKRIFKLAQKHGTKVFAVVSNMNIALERRDFFRNVDCFICNKQEAGMLFSDDYMEFDPEQMREELSRRVQQATIPGIIVTMGAKGAVFATAAGESGWCPARNVAVCDTTGAGDAFAAGAAIGLTYGKSMAEACGIGSLLAASVIMTSDNVWPRFQPAELGLCLEEG